MNMKDNVMNHIAMSDRKVIGDHNWKGNLDLTNIVMIGVAKRIPEHTEEYELHRLLGTLLSDEMLVDEKINIIEQEYDILTEKNAEEEMKIMCNLGQGIEDRAMVQGIEKGEANIISCMYKNGLSVEKIAEVTENSQILHTQFPQILTSCVNAVH